MLRWRTYAVVVATQRTYTPEQRAEALRLYREVGPSEAGSRLDIAPSTVRKWAQRAGASAPRAARTAAAVQAAQLSREQRAEEIAAEALEAAGEFLTRSREANPTNARLLMAAFRDALNGSQLLAGDPTDRLEVSDLMHEVDRELAELAKVRERNAELAAQNGDPS